MDQQARDGLRIEGAGSAEWSQILPATSRWFTDHGAVEGESWVVEPLAAGAIAERVELIRRGDRAVVRKWAPEHEIAALRAAQEVRPQASAIPELIEAGRDQDGAWYTAPYYPGESTTALTDGAIDSLARLHVHFRSAHTRHSDIPTITTDWWRQLCRFWVLPGVERHGARHGQDVEQRARSLVNTLEVERGVHDVLAGITPTLLHGDVHSGNVIFDGTDARLIDWGSARFGTPLLDLINMVDADSPAFETYLRAHARHGVTLSDEEIQYGLQWTALQLPVQYLPWQLEHSATPDVRQALQSAEEALESIRVLVLPS